MSDKPQQPKKPGTVIKKIDENRYKAQRGKVVVTFVVDDAFHITTLKGPNSDETKEYKFVCSDPLMMAKVTKVLNVVAWYVEKLRQEANGEHHTAESKDQA